MKSRLMVMAALIAMLGAVNVGAQANGVEIGNVETPTLRWGHQTAVFELTNKTEDLKFIAVLAKMSFSGTYLNASRLLRTNYVLEPQSTMTARAAVDIPANFGEATLTIQLYDVVDTLDKLLPSQKFFEQPFMLKFHIPDPLLRYMETRIAVPPMVDHTPDFDNEFSRVLLELLAEGRTVPEIAAMAMADSAVVQNMVDTLRFKNYLVIDAGKYKLQFPMIRAAEAEEAAILAKAASEQLAVLIKKNLPAFLKVRDSLVAAGKLTTDTNAFMNGGVILFKPYPAIGALLLWNDFGQGFIAGRTPLEILGGSDPCNAYSPTYMYAVEGGDVVNGSHYYDMSLARRRQIINWADRVPTVECPEKLRYTDHLQERLDWNYARGDIADVYVFDTALVNAPMRTLGKGSTDMLQKLFDDYKKISERYHPGQFTMGSRYWFWNLVATKTLSRLVTEGVVQRGPINGHFRLEANQ
jgi:hypothetical protein